MHTCFTAFPGVPQMISAAETSRHAENTCIILVIWSPPTDSESDVSDIAYIVYVPSRHKMINVSSSTILSTITVPDCDNDIRVQVAAVNRGCVGMNSSEVKPILLDIPTSTESTTESISEVGSSTTASIDSATAGGCTSTSSK